MRAETVWTDARLLTFADGGLGRVEGGAVAAQGGRIVYAGAASGAPEGERVVRCEGRWITPGLVDCHTHLVFAGNRAGEFERRLAGESYAAIAAGGGGIMASVRATRGEDEAGLVRGALGRLDRLMAEGVTTVEVKSGYGLETGAERRMLRAARALGRALGRARAVRVVTSFLGAHAVPEGVGAEAYVELVCGEMLPALAGEGLVDAVDAFCETIAFSPAQVGRVFGAARALGLPVKLHADQLSDGGGAALAAEWGALSADHLEHAGEAGVAAMGRAGTVAVLLPGAFYLLRERRAPPVDAMRRHGCGWRWRRTATRGRRR